MKGSKITAAIFLCLSLLCGFVAGKSYLAMNKEETIVDGPGVSEIRMLSDYYPGLKGTNGDTKVYVLKGEKPGGSMLVLGGTHPNEPSGFMSAVTLIENARLDAGTLYVIPRANNSAFTHNDPQEGSPQKFVIDTPDGERWFRYGSRATNPIDQWPDPDVYIHASSGQQLSGSETRNLNRAYPGRPDGTLTEKIAYGITEMIKKEKIDVSIDLHEASPEYPVINATVSHERGMAIASQAVINLQLKGIEMGLEPSPTNLHGLTHRELGDYTDTIAILMETANAAQGRLRGKTDENLVLTGKDKSYVKAAKLGRLFVPYDENGHPIEERVGRHLEGINEISKAFSKEKVDRPIVIENVPSYNELIDKGIGSFLNPLK
ncbi:succinylglutamate desuccinylase/aspartoacylase family protein [uncultured Clostridium sp.]|uniref:succinylglutamate desuccinylase/aspartoacylase family protein n=1 Tax=uncultured Clostridium sp. TaxID=59620 RepID=UPI0028EE6FE9|nr:succinylglutamate desuccinylase/aspartoacylase family protein [uncultured Clostridium sp.]